jgi:hypothetical protein
MADKLTQEQLIKNYDKARKKLDDAEEAMRIHFNRLAMPKIKAAKTLEELRLVKESLRPMPDSVGKVLLFRAILISEDVIKGEACTKCLLSLDKCTCN